MGSGGSHGPALPPHPRHHGSMDISTLLYISPTSVPETMTALTLRYVEEREATADRYLRATLRSFMFDLYPHEAFELIRTFTTETVSEIRNFEGGGRAGSTSRCGG